ncbi:hypothetical protein CAC42_3166 [Sphaceloma murrayae]|uniref:AAA+ ATPase domain-containing protein n=1 Tax=Sphaceloma murrayae TaxID=2082308 RepID=A0A2K1QRV3_9PEZI|nr:hypothetical protein CAC42_3166 [Sphaceloma murrayae]
MEPFSIVEETPDRQLVDKFQELTSAHSADHDIQYQATLRERFPELTLTAVPANNCNILAFAGAGHASVDIDTTTDPIFTWRGWLPSYGRNSTASIGQTTFFAKYHINWSGEDFIMYVVGGVQYILKEPRGQETTLSPSRATDKLIEAAGTWQNSDQDIVWVFDNFWRQDKTLWEQVAKAKWENVILDEQMKKDLTSVSTKFFDNEDVYKELGVPWKRGLIFHGPAGNGKTISIKALMHTLHDREKPIKSLYVKTAPATYYIGQVFAFARRCSPCMLIFEDIETIINEHTRSYFLNEVDGLESNDGILMVASTNYLERLDPGITKRPSRFDRKYLFPLPNHHERTLYAEFWRKKVTSKSSKKTPVDFPERLCSAMASITDGFSFAYMQEAFVATFLTLARDATEDEAPGTSDDPLFRPPYLRTAASQALYNHLNPGTFDRPPPADLEQYRLWRIFKSQVQILRGNMDDTEPAEQPSFYSSAMKAAPISTAKAYSPPRASTSSENPLSTFARPDIFTRTPTGPELNQHKLQDYQMQLMLLEQQNMKRLLRSRQEAEEASRRRHASHPNQPPVDTFAGLPDALAKLDVKSEAAKSENTVQATDKLPDLPVDPLRRFHPTIGPTRSVTADLPAEGAVGRKWPSVNPASFNWGPT